jgi:type I restriction enzyme S subunit
MRKNTVRKKICEICDKASSNIAQNKLEGVVGDYPVFGASGFVQNVDFYHRDSEYIGIVKDGSGVGRVKKYPAYSSLLGTMQYIIPKEGNILGYVAYALQSLDLASFASGAAIPHIYFKDYGQCEIDVPSMSEQERIVAELDLLNGVLDKQNAQLKELDNLAQAIFYDMFGAPIENPKGWGVKMLGDEVNIVGGYAFKSNCFVSVGIPVLRIGNINSGKVKTDQIVFYNEDDKLAKYMVYPNDLVISLTGTAGKEDYGNICKLDSSYPRYYLNQRNAKLELGNRLKSCYVQYLFKDKSIKGTLTAVNRGVRQGNISNKDIENLIVPIPPLTLQQSFAEKIQSIEKQKEAIRASIADTQKLLDYTMDKYFG